MNYAQGLETVISIMLVLPVALNLLIVLTRDKAPRLAYWLMRITPLAVAVAAAPREKMLAVAAQWLADEVKASPLPDDAPASVAAVKVESLVSSDATKTTAPTVASAGLLLVLAIGGSAVGCASPLTTAVSVADAGAAVAESARPLLDQACVEPMSRAARLRDNELALAVAAKCDGPMMAYESLRIAHVALRGAILEVYGGSSHAAALLAQVPELARAGARLAAAVRALSTGTVTP